MTFEDAGAVAAWLLEREFAGDVEPAGMAGTIALSAFQAEAARRAERILERYGGVLVADSVGLGKTYIGLSLMESYLRRGTAQVLVATPASLRAQWWPLLRRVARAAAVSLITARGTAGAGRPLICWLSHTALSRERWPAALRPDLTLVDEAHAFRHPDTRRYRALANVCRSSRMVLLTATPVNNSLRDLYWQLRLFLADHALAEAGVSDLRLAFAESESVGRLVPPLDSAVAAVTVRRTRRMVVEREPSAIAQFPRRAPPAAITYDIEAVVPSFYQRIGDAVAGLKLEAFRVAVGPARECRAPVELVRYALLKRLESSVHAFHSSIGFLERYLRSFARATLDGYRLSPADHRTLAGPGRNQLALFGVALDPLPGRVHGKALADSALADAQRLCAMRGLVEPLLGADPKLGALLRTLHGPLADRKVLIFTEFRDTAVHLWQSLQNSFRVALVHGGGARLGAMPLSRAEAVSRFSPLSNGRAPPASAERVDVLIATDVLSEGMNLQDAAHVVSYDLPWNPVRLIQRMGRIDRLGSPHECVYCWNFLPGQGLETLLGLVARLAVKLGAIEAIGEDSRVLSARRRQGAPRSARRDAPRGGSGARPQGGSGVAIPVGRITIVVHRLERSDPLLFEDLEQQEEGPFAILERARALAIARRLHSRPEATGSGTGHARTDLGGPGPRFGAAHCAAGEGAATIIVIEMAERAPLRWFVVEDDRLREDRLTALRRLTDLLDSRVQRATVRVSADMTASGVSVAAAGVSACDPAPDIREYEQVSRLALQAVQSPLSMTPRSVRGTIALVRRRVMRALAREPGGASPALCARADRLLEALCTGQRAGRDLAVARALREVGARGLRQPHATGPGRAGGPVSAEALIERLEVACCAYPETTAPEADSGPRALAVLGLRPQVMLTN